MDCGIRFSSPSLEKNDYIELSKILNLEYDDLIDIIENAPYEVSILVSLLKRILERLQDI